MSDTPLPGPAPVPAHHPLSARFRGFYPVVIDVETTGFENARHGILEISAALLTLDREGWLAIDRVLDYQVQPFAGAVIEPSAIAFHGIDPADPDRCAETEAVVLQNLFREVRHAQKLHDCQRSIVVAHNAHFDHGFLQAAVRRQDIKRDPFHPFSCFDTATLSGLAFGQTVLAKACETAGIAFSNSDAHSASYDTRKTAELFCAIVNRWTRLGGWPLPGDTPLATQ